MKKFISDNIVWFVLAALILSAITMWKQHKMASATTEIAPVAETPEAK